MLKLVYEDPLLPSKLYGLPRGIQLSSLQELLLMYVCLLLPYFLTTYSLYPLFIYVVFPL